MHILLAQTDRLLPAIGQRLGLQALALHRRGHQPAEGVRGIGYQHHPLPAVGSGELDRVGIAQFPHRNGSRVGLGAAHRHRLHKGAHPDAQRALDVALVEFEHQRGLAGDLPHHPYDLVREIGIVPAAETDDLHILQPRITGGKDRRREHPGMVVVDDVQCAAAQIHLGGPGHRIDGEHRDPQCGKHLRQIVVHQRIVLIGTGGQHHRIASGLANLVEDPCTRRLQLRSEGALGPIGGGDGSSGFLRGDAAAPLHVSDKLIVPVGIVIPEEHRGIKRDAPLLFRTVRIADNKGIPLDHRAHRIAGLLGVLGGHNADGGHKDAVHLLLYQVADVPMHQFGREADGVRGHRRKAAFIEFAGARPGDLDSVSKRLEKGLPEGHIVPEGEHPGQPDDRVPLLCRCAGVVPEQELFPQGKQVRNFFLFQGLFPDLLPDGSICRIAEDLPLLTAVVGHPAAAVGEGDDGAFAVVHTERTGGVGGLGVGEVLQGVQPDEGAPAIFHPLLCQQRRTDGSHDARIGCTGHLAADVLLQRCKYRIVAEGAALDNDGISQRIQIGNADDLGEHILDDRPAETGHDVPGEFAVALLGDDRAVHKDRAAAAELGRMPGGEGSRGDPVHRDPQ